MGYWLIQLFRVHSVVDTRKLLSQLMGQDCGLMCRDCSGRVPGIWVQSHSSIPLSGIVVVAGKPHGDAAIAEM
jgi:hypothetical protein